MSKNTDDKLEREQPPFTIIENAIIEDEKVSLHGLAAYLILCKHCNGEKQAWPGYERIAKLARCSRRRAIKAVQELIDAGYISKEHRFRQKDNAQSSNIYRILSQYTYIPNKRRGGAPGALGGVNGVHRRGAHDAPKLDPLELDTIGRKDPPSILQKVLDKLREIRHRDNGYGVYSKPNDLNMTLRRKAAEVNALLSRDGERTFLRTYAYYMRSTEPGLIKAQHPLRIFLAQYDEWLEKSGLEPLSG